MSAKPKVSAQQYGDWSVSLINAGLVPEVYDYLELGYTGDNITTVIYKTGGASGTTVATLTIAYSGSNITSVTKV